MSVERIQRFRSRVLYVFLGVLEMQGIRRGRAAAHYCEPRNVWPNRNLQVAVHVARAALVSLERGDIGAQVADESQISAEFYRGFVKGFLIRQILSPNQSVFSQLNRGAQSRFRILGRIELRPFATRHEPHRRRRGHARPLGGRLAQRAGRQSASSNHLRQKH